MKSLEKRLSLLHQRKHVLITGSATTAIYLCLKALGISEKNVLIPNNTCINVPLGVLASGNTPCFTDIVQKNMGIDPDLICRKKGSAVIAVHSYGSVCDLEKITSACKREGIPLIEDVAVAQGANYKGKPCGSFGIASVLSFGIGKIIDPGHGGAVLTDDTEFYESLLSLNRQLTAYSSERQQAISDLSSFHTQFYNMFYPSNVEENQDEFLSKLNKVLDKHIYGFDRHFLPKINSALEGLSENISSREQNSKLFRESINCQENHFIDCFDPPEGSVYWRFNLLIDKPALRDRLLVDLLSQKFKVSSWFPSTDRFFASNPDRNFPISDYAGKRILNLWVNHQIDQNYIKEISDKILNFINIHGDKIG